jgi:hypothetical protein
MTARTQDGMNVVLALAVPAAGLAYLMSGVSSSPEHFSVAVTVVLGMLLFVAMAARNAIVGPQQEVATGPLTPARDRAANGPVDASSRNADDNV